MRVLTEKAALEAFDDAWIYLRSTVYALCESVQDASYIGTVSTAIGYQKPVFRIPEEKRGWANFHAVWRRGGKLSRSETAAVVLQSYLSGIGHRPFWVNFIDGGSLLPSPPTGPHGTKSVRMLFQEAMQNRLLRQDKARLRVKAFDSSGREVGPLLLRVPHS